MKILATTILAFALAGCGGGDDAVTHTAKYKIYGDTSIAALGSASTSPTSASITYERNGVTEQKTVALPYFLDLGTVSEGQFLYISAQGGGGVGPLNVEIDVDGKAAKKGASTGQFSIATASYTCCQ